MTSNLKAQFESKIADQTKDHTIEEVTETKEIIAKNWSHSGNSGGACTNDVLLIAKKKYI